MCDEGAEPRLAPPAMEVLGERRSLDRKRDLRGERLERVDELALRRLAVVASSTPRVSPRTESGRSDAHRSPSRVELATDRSPGAPRPVPPASRGWPLSANARICGDGSPRSWLPLEAASSAPSAVNKIRRTALSVPSSDCAAWTAAPRTPSPPAAATSSTPACRSASSRAACRSSWRTSPAMRETTRRNRIAEATMTTSTSGLPNLFRKADAGSDQARDGEEAEPQRSQTRPDVRRRLVESTHRGVERGCAPQDVVGDPADVEAELMVVAVDEQGVGVRAVDDEQRDDAGDEQVEGRRTLAGVDREANHRGEEQDVSERIGGRHALGERAKDRTDGCSARRGSPTRGARIRRSGSARRFRPRDHRRGFRRRTSSSSPPTRAG